MAMYFSSLLTVLQPLNISMLFLCSVMGVILGAIPGLSGGLGITLLLPVTFALSSELSFCMLLGMYVGGITGSFISAVLVGIPGSAASISTSYDGYPMTKKGQAGKALSIGITASFMGTVVSIIVATIMSSFIADLALMLGPWEYFSLCFMAVSLVVGMSRGSIYKGLLGAFIGLWLSTIGTDQVTNAMRFTFKNYNLYGGIPVVALLMGVFAVQQVASSYAHGNLTMPDVDTANLKGFGLKLRDFAVNAKTIVTSLLIGLWIGFLPGLGSGVSGMVAYGQAKKMSKKPEEFGTGIDAGVWASEASNNATVGGALIPMISLGIPGDGATVLLLSAMIIHGLQPGPLFISRNPELAYLIFAAVLVSAALVFALQLVTKRWFPYLLKAPYHYLYSTILMICFIGAFSNTTSMFSVYLTLGFGALGILLELIEIPIGPMMLAYILGGNLESYFRRGVSFAKGDMSVFLTRPISCILLLIGLYSLFAPMVKFFLKAAKARKKGIVSV